jgi:hypothetical protein
MADAVFIYPGFLTKGLKGTIRWHPDMPSFDRQRSDWDDRGCVDLTRCVNDPWPDSEGGALCFMEVRAP